MKSHGHLGVAEIAAMLGVTRQRTYAIKRTYPDFPEPVAELAMGSLWHENDVRAWLACHPTRPPGRPPARPVAPPAAGDPASADTGTTAQERK